MIARPTAVLTALALAAVEAHAAPLATLAEDLDGDGVPDAIELGADGVVHIAGKPRGELRLAAALTAGQLAVTRYRGATYVIVQLSPVPAPGAPVVREAVIVRADGGAWHELTRTTVGGVGLDHDYGIEVEAAPDGIYRYQTRGDIRRCDGKPAYLFAEKFDGARFRRTSALPTGVADTAPVLVATRDPGRTAPPAIYQARAASYEVGVGDAGGLAIPSELDDGRLDTVWREELAASTGEGQFFTFEPRATSALARQVRIAPGNPASSATLRSFNRPRRLAIVAAHEAWRVELPDAAAEPLGAAYVIDLPHPVAGCVTVVLESTYGAPQGTTAIAELEVFADGERAAGGETMLARVVADGGAGATAAANALGKRGAPGVAAIEAALAATTAPDIRRRLIGALVEISDPAAAGALGHAAAAGWVRGRDLLDVIGALGALGEAQALHDLASNEALPVEARVAAVARLPVTGAGFTLLVELAGGPPRRSPGPIDDTVRALRRAVIERASAAPVDELLAAVAAQGSPAAAGDLWCALARGAHAAPANRPAALAAMLAALPAATDYERSYRLVDGIAALGDLAALRLLAATLERRPAATEAAALRQVALHAIAANPRPEAVALALALTRDGDPGVRMAAVTALAAGEAGDAWRATAGAIDDAIAHALSGDAWPEVRRRAATALAARCTRTGPAAALVEAVDRDRELAVRGDALSALVACRAPGVAALLARVWNDDGAPVELRTRAVLEAVALGDPKLAATLVAAFTRWRGEATGSAPALALAQNAAAAIGRLAAPGAAAALTEALDDGAFPELVEAAALGLGALGPACPAGARTKLAELAGSDSQAAVAARRALARCGK